MKQKAAAVGRRQFDAIGLKSSPSVKSQLPSRRLAVVGAGLHSARPEGAG